MIRMTRVRLINWHNFIDDIVEFKTISYMIGVNAVGKTTIMDAIRKDDHHGRHPILPDDQ